jgi:hypothetical protein
MPSIAAFMHHAVTDIALQRCICRTKQCMPWLFLHAIPSITSNDVLLHRSDIFYSSSQDAPHEQQAGKAHRHRRASRVFPLVRTITA